MFIFPKVIKNKKYRRKFYVFLFDVFIIGLSVLVSYFIYSFSNGYNYLLLIKNERFFHFLFFVIFLHPVILYVLGFYDLLEEKKGLYSDILLVLSFIILLVIYLALSRVIPFYLHTKFIFLFYFFVSFFFFYVKRMLYFVLLEKYLKEKTKVLFIEKDILTNELKKELNATDYEIVGLVSFEGARLREEIDGIKVVSTGRNLRSLIKSKKIKILILSIDKNIPIDILKKIYISRYDNVEVYRSDEFYEIITRKFPIKHFVEEGIVPYINIDAFTNPFYRNIKTLIDITLSFILLFLSSPLFLIVAILIKLTSNGPIFFIQERVGFQEKPLKIIKFRTMYMDAEKNGPQWAQKNDTRVTPIGKLLRKTRLDEIPQLINILKGDMSFIGPRPIRRYFANIIKKEVPFYPLRFNIKPGLTGWAQVNASYGSTLKEQIEKLQYDLYYVKNASLLLDMFILVKTFQIILKGAGH